ncbi:MAG: ComEC/Rec2 family competence protein [Planctomycetaceae bacterium]|nr:ComEC/Rec2 family competence protein [Planctomycetaceae bacterium]
MGSRDPDHATLHAPALPVVIAFVAGILIDRVVDLPFPAWGGLCAVGLAFSWLENRSQRWKSWGLMLFVACLALGGMRHHLRWSILSPFDVSRYAEGEGQSVQLVGIIESPLTVRAADHSDMTPPWMQVDRSQCDLLCESLVSRQATVPVVGRLRLIVTGHVLHANVGDRVEVTGRLVMPRGPQNPGGFDYRKYLREDGIRCLLDVDHPDAVRVLQTRVAGQLERLRTRMRDECEDILVHHIDRVRVPLAMSLLLGERSALPQDVYDAFTESGTMHLLAISGLHVGILAALLLVTCRLLKLSLPATTVVLLLGIAAYAFVTNHRPPVVRASILAVIAAAGWPWFRQVGGPNLIAICGLIVLLINPTDLFDVGTQLSFLCVVAIGGAAVFLKRWQNHPLRSARTEWLFEPHGGLLQRTLRMLVEGYVITAAIWVFAMPLIAARFHVVAPIGFLINVLMLPVVGVTLWLGFITLLCGLIAPWLVRWPAAVFDWFLSGIQSVVDTTAELPGGHASVAGPEDWWLVGFYSLLSIGILVQQKVRFRDWTWHAVGGWTILGLALPLLPQHREGLRCTFLSVGHGCAVVLELPSGETLLYDAGMFGSAQQGRAIIQNALWERGINGIDAIIISHADVDHFNAVAGLLEAVPVGTLCFDQSFLDFEQLPVAALCETASREAVPIKLLQAGDRLQLGGSDVELTILHPSARSKSNRDNANSLVLRVQYADRIILLTGDLEEDGLAQLLNTPSEPIDVMLSPHHGSPKANPITLSRWASPGNVIISGGELHSDDMLHAAYPDAKRVLSTQTSGAVTCEIAKEGTLSIEEWNRPFRVNQEND